MNEKAEYVYRINDLLNKRAYDISEAAEFSEYLALTVIAVLVPLLFRHPQILVGSVVNFILVLAAINIRGWNKIMPLIILPSLSAVAGGVLFGPFTIFLIYLVPFIWVGNAILVLVFKYVYVEKGKNYGITLLSATGLKAGFLFIIAILLIQFSVVPAIFEFAMGLVQFATAIIGGSLAFPVNRIYKKYFLIRGV